MARSVGGSSVCSTVDGVSVITKCARLSISSSIMLAHQASSSPGGGASAGVRALHQPASCFIFDGDRRYVPLYPRTQSPPAHLIPHLALGSTSTSTTPEPDRRRAHSRNKVRTWGSWALVRGYLSHPPTHGRPGWLRHRMFPWSSATGTLGSIFVSFLAPSNHGHAGIMRLQRYKRQRYLWPSYLGCAAHPLLMPSLLLPPLLPTCDRAWQAMAEGTDRQAYSPATRLLAFVLSKWAILEWTATARTPRT